MSPTLDRSIAGKVATTLAAALAAAYFFQSSTLAPNRTDEGLLLGYVDDMAHGVRPFHDFVDVYGFLNWIFPVAFYEAFGEQVWGVRVWMLVLKLVTLGIAYALMRSLAHVPGEPDGWMSGGRFYAALGALWTVTLLGAQWQLLQTPYPFLTVMPLVLGAWCAIVLAPFRSTGWNVLAAAMLTACTVWTKLNTGLYLLAGGLLAYLFWIDLSRAPAGSSGIGGGRLLPLARRATLVAAGVLPLFAIRQHFTLWYFLYLAVPLIWSLGWALRATAGRGEAAPEASGQLRTCATYLLATSVLSTLLLLAYSGRHALDHVRQIFAIVSWLNYAVPFPPLGAPGGYVGFNEYYWLELPWAVTAAFAVWTLLGNRFGPKAFGAGWTHRRAQVSALFLLLVAHSFVMYSRHDESHIYQVVVLAVPVLFVVLAQIEAFVSTNRPALRGALRVALGSVCVWYASSLTVVPRASSFSVGKGDWHSPKLEHLRYRDAESRYVRYPSPLPVSDRECDRAEDDAAEYVGSLARPGEALVLTSDRLIHLTSGTRPVGGRYHFLFYLTSTGLLDRAGFDALVPRQVVEDILADPPPVIVSSLESAPLQEVFPEFRLLRDTQYTQTRQYCSLVVYERTAAR